SAQARFLVPMAISLGFGILLVTFIALILVPCLYLIIDDVERLLAWLGEAARGEYETLAESDAQAVASQSARLE
ncbi:MAG: hypothetical protein AAFS10_09165, partial [Myxococcota bacterium]